jgi:galactose-1-phosphate uridylyltransferase
MPLRIKEIGGSDISALITRSREQRCPFCPGAIEKKTARFLPGFALTGGRIAFEETTIFPNAFPYDDYSAVAVISREHFLSPAQFEPKLLHQAFQTCAIYFERAREAMPTARYALLNWNYMPLAGAGIVHPHFQLTALREPTTYHGLIIKNQQRYGLNGGRSIFDDLIAQEREDQQRYLSQIGHWHWLPAFAPRGLYEFWGLLDTDLDVLDTGEENLWDLSRGINAILRFFEDKGVQAFNMCWYSYYKPAASGLRNMVALMPRINFPPMETSDVNYFDRLHGESVTFVIPEEVTPEVKGYFPAPL